MDSLMPQHKRLAIGETLVEANEAPAVGWPERCGPDSEPSLSRGTGRKPDARKSGMPSDQPTRAPFFEGGEDPQGKIVVSAYERSRPGMMAYD